MPVFQKGFIQKSFKERRQSNLQLRILKILKRVWGNPYLSDSDNSLGGFSINKEKWVLNGCPFLIQVYDGKWSFKQLLKSSKKIEALEMFDDLCNYTPPNLKPLLIITKSGSELFVISDLEYDPPRVCLGDHIHIYHLNPFLEQYCETKVDVPFT